jgi:hypothetical protein
MFVGGAITNLLFVPPTQSYVCLIAPPAAIAIGGSTESDYGNAAASRSTAGNDAAN